MLPNTYPSIGVISKELFVIVKLESIHRATLDDEMTKKMSREIFEEEIESYTNQIYNYFVSKNTNSIQKESA